MSWLWCMCSDFGGHWEEASFQSEKLYFSDLNSKKFEISGGDNNEYHSHNWNNNEHYF